MSTLMENVDKVVAAHAAIGEAIKAKGVAVPEGTKLSGMPPLIEQIQVGGGGGGEDQRYLTFTSDGPATLILKQQRDAAPLKLLKSTDGVNWVKWENPYTNGISLDQPYKPVYIKADEDALHRTASDDWSYNKFDADSPIFCTGDIQSIVKPIVPADYTSCFAGLFAGFYYLVQAPELPATYATESCYNKMFAGCSCLSQVPELPATQVRYGCYSSMFLNCTALKRIKMNASSGSWGTQMFDGCTSLELVDMTGSTGVPYIPDINNFANTNDTYKIVVPDSLYDTWIAETNWATIADHIMKQSDWNAEHPDDVLG